MLGAKRTDVLFKVGLPRSLPYFFASLKVAITLAFVGTTVSEMTASNEGIGYLLISAGSALRMPLAFAGLVVIAAMAMAMYELFAYVEKHTTGDGRHPSATRQTSAYQAARAITRRRSGRARQARTASRSRPTQWRRRRRARQSVRRPAQQAADADAGKMQQAGGHDEARA